VRPGEDVGHPDDVGAVLGIDDLGAAGHRQDVVGKQGAQREVGGGADVDGHAFGSADQAVVLQDPLVGVELLACDERDGVHPAFGVGELHLVALGQRPASPYCFVCHSRRG
jgi:hypothetical protein